MGKIRPAFVNWFTDTNARAEAYAQMRLKNELWPPKDSHEVNQVKIALACSFLKIYYLFSAPVVTLIARSNRLMSLARLLYAPTRHVVRKILR